jgi:hypothetical protein
MKNDSYDSNKFASVKNYETLIMNIIWDIFNRFKFLQNTTHRKLDLFLSSDARQESCLYLWVSRKQLMWIIGHSGLRMCSGRPLDRAALPPYRALSGLLIGLWPASDPILFPPERRGMIRRFDRCNMCCIDSNKFQADAALKAYFISVINFPGKSNIL